MHDIPLLKCINICKYYQEGMIYHHILHNVSFSLKSQEMIAIIGNSGSGKSTLLHILGGLDQPTSGEVFLAGQRLNTLSSKQRAKIRNNKLGFIYQFHHLLKDFTALENVAMPLLIGGTKSSHAKKKAIEMLARVGMEKQENHFPSELSGGEKQRVSIARALINEPPLVLADEPTGNLDKRNANTIYALIKEFNVFQGTAFLIVTHDLKLAKKLHRSFEIYDGILGDI